MSQAALRPLTISPPIPLLSLSSISVSQNPLSPLQTQVDGLVGSFTQQATDWRSLTAMVAGGVTYRLGRVGTLATGTGRLASLGIGLGAEVTAFEMTNRSLSSLTGETHANSNLWRWEGQGGIRQGLLSSLVTFASLKGMGGLAPGENVVVQHLLQDTGMVLGHQVSGAFGIIERPQGTLAEQFLHAEVTNLQLSAGMALVHSVAPGMQGLERGLDLSLRSMEIPPSPLWKRWARGDLALATTGSGIVPARDLQTSPLDPQKVLVLHMSPKDEKGNGGGSDSEPPSSGPRPSHPPSAPRNGHELAYEVSLLNAFSQGDIKAG